jgi:hypothetical protein
MVKIVSTKVEKKRVKKAARETDAIRTPSAPGWDSSEEIRKWRDVRRTPSC